MTATTTHADTPVAERLAQRVGVRQAIDALVREVESASSEITGVRGPIDGRRIEYDRLLAETAQARGRGLFYPYLGSGLGRGALVELADGSVKYDMISGIGVHFFGHSEPELVGIAAEAALGDTVMQGNLQMNADATRFAQTLLEEASKASGLAHAFLTNSGAMANESALKVCFQKRAPACRVIAFRDCFMGRTWTLSQIGDSPAGRVGLPLNTLVDYMPFYDEAAARRLGAGDRSGTANYIDICVEYLGQCLDRYPDQHACFVFELIQGEGGFRTAPREFFVELMTVCRDRGVPVWVDEIQTFGRTDRMFCFDALGLGEYVDVCTVGKMSQVCACLYTQEMNPKPGLLSGTFIGSTVGLRVGRRIIERLRDGGYYGPDGSNARHFEAFAGRVRALKEKHPEWFPPAPGVVDVVAGRGGMMRFTPFGGEKDKIVALCRTLFDEGVITFFCGHGPHHVRMLPPLGVLREQEWGPVFEIVQRALARCAG
ncbi:MAG: aminotransferase class III-fold pyridoxal phosphate-dependent enzyme [Planctomycetota bacterium]|nr:MAG: aminotransferase class III-fold pyridoxal phosphate-dependent enzyme [Planctomycetota bacterium]